MATTRAAVVAVLVATSALVALAQINHHEPPTPAPAGPTKLERLPHLDRDGSRSPLARMTEER